MKSWQSEVLTFSTGPRNILSRSADKHLFASPYVDTKMSTVLTEFRAPPRQPLERLAYSVHEAAEVLGVHYFSVYWLVQRGKLHVCREIPGKLLIPRSELLRLLNN